MGSGIQPASLAPPALAGRFFTAQPLGKPRTLLIPCILSRSGGEKGLRGSGAGTLDVPLGGTRRVGGLLGVAGRLSGTVSPFSPKAATGLASHEPLVLTGLMGAGSARNQLGVPGGVLRSPEPPILKTTCVETPPSLNSLSCSVPVAPTPITGPRVEDLTCGGPCRCVERW